MINISFLNSTPASSHLQKMTFLDHIYGTDEHSICCTFFERTTDRPERTYIYNVVLSGPIFVLLHIKHYARLGTHFSTYKVHIIATGEICAVALL